MGCRKAPYKERSDAHGISEFNDSALILRNPELFVFAFLTSAACEYAQAVLAGDGTDASGMIRVQMGHEDSSYGGIVKPL
jgi:hypothetical protein